MGGGVSQRFVIDNPGYAKKLVLFESVPPTGNPVHKKGTNGEKLAECHQTKEDVWGDMMQVKSSLDALEQNNRPFIKYLWNILVFNVAKPSDEEYEILLDDIFMTRNLKGAAWAAHTFNISHIHNGVVPGSMEVDKIDIPVLVTAADKDIIVPVKMHEFTVKEIGDNARLEIFTDCSHAPQYCNLGLAASKIISFINE